MKIMCEPEIIEINLMSFEIEEFDENVVKIDAWYDRYTRDYCIQLLNKDGYQVGDAYRVGNKEDKNSLVKELKEEYEL